MTAAGKEKEIKEEKKGSGEMKQRVDKLESDVRIVNLAITVINKNLNGAKGANGRPKGKSLADAFQDAEPSNTNESPTLPQLKNTITQ